MPKLIGGKGIAGICLIRLREIRPKWTPRGLGIRSENATHGIAVCLPDGREGLLGLLPRSPDLPSVGRPLRFGTADAQRPPRAARPRPLYCGEISRRG